MAKAKRDYALVRELGLFSVTVFSTHRTKDEAERALRKAGRGADSHWAESLRVVNVGADGTSELIEIFGKRTLRPRLPNTKQKLE